jgi:PAS domain S-box-containing protein
MTGGRSTWVRKSATAVMIGVDESIEDVLGWKAEDLLGKTSLDFIHPDDQTLAVENWMQMLASAGAPWPVRLRHRHRDGRWIWIELTNRNLLDDSSESCVVADMLELLEQEPYVPSGPDEENGNLFQESRPLQLHEALREREQLLHRLAEALPVGVLHVDATGRVLYTNRQLHAIVGKERAFYYKDQFSTVIPEDEQNLTDAFEAALHGGLDNDIEVRIAVPDGSGAKERRQCTLSVRTLLSDRATQPERWPLLPM